MIQWTISQLIVWKIHTAHDREHDYQDSFTLCRDCTTLPWLWRSSCQQKHKVFFFAPITEQAEYKRSTQKKEYEVGFIYLWTLLSTKGGKAQAFVSKILFYKKLLASDWSDSSFMAKTKKSRQTHKDGTTSTLLQWKSSYSCVGVFGQKVTYGYLQMKSQQWTSA
jgi:hypothetical protein